MNAVPVDKAFPCAPPASSDAHPPDRPSNQPPTMTNTFTRIVFRRYKALRHFSITLDTFNVLVGPNNAGKSTIIGAFRILSEGMRIATSKKPTYHRTIDSFGYRVPLKDLPVATENIFTDYDATQPASIEFTLSSGDGLRLVFPATDVCFLITEPAGRSILSPSDFKKIYNGRIGFVPILGPVEHNEPLYQREAARLALLTHRASRNFRNIWYHYPDDFADFRQLVMATWPDMDVERPEVDYYASPKPLLHMFCPEGRHAREIFWAGFGFQVWCQMLTYIVRARDASLLVIDEPDIYLHSDLQRQLVGILKDLTPHVLIATHSTEIISEADAGDLLVIDKKKRSAKRIQSMTLLPSIFEVLGSSLNPTLTRLAKTRRVVFVEGKDFKLLAALARKVGLDSLANQSDFAVVPIGGFNPSRIVNLSDGIEATLGLKVLKAVVLDKDFRSDDEVRELRKKFDDSTSLTHIHQRKEIENYLLVPSTLQRAMERKIRQRSSKTDSEKKLDRSSKDILLEVTDKMKSNTAVQLMSTGEKYLKRVKPGVDSATINEIILRDFETAWPHLDERLEIVPGKKCLSAVNEYLQNRYSISLTESFIISSMNRNEMPSDLLSLLQKLETFRSTRPPEA